MLLAQSKCKKYLNLLTKGRINLSYKWRSSYAQNIVTTEKDMFCVEERNYIPEMLMFQPKRFHKSSYFFQPKYFMKLPTSNSLIHFTNCLTSINN